MFYSVIWKPGVQDKLDGLETEIRDRIKRRIEDLRNNPYGPGTKKLKGNKIYKNRVGKYRILFNINDSVLEIAVIAIRKRDNRTYKGLDRL